MNELGVAKHYPMLHKTTYFNSDVELKNLESIFDNIVNIPIHHNLTEKDLDCIVRALNE
jgi:dTDP-4-amino-4,6-dideoxygalactose transaminase